MIETVYETPFDVIGRHKRSVPVDVDALAADLSIPIIYAHYLAPNVSGLIKRTSEHGGESGFAIIVNARHPPARQRFTIAHEIAHYALHRDLIEKEIVDNELYRADGVWSLYEVQANNLAAEILLPSDTVRRVYRDRKGIHDLAQAFQVSSDAVRVRLKTLRLAP